MTVHIADIASYQGALTAEQLLAAGVTAVNVKVSHGLTLRSVHERAAQWLADARFTHSTFHWLTPDASGTAQATFAYRSMELLGAARSGVAHVVDMEQAGITASQYMDYVLTMRELLGHDVITYTGDWRWPASWVGANISPWLWAAPNAGYLPSYPGDASPHWRAGYGGWANLSAMQYAVLPVAGVRVSLSAVRDATLWERMRGVPMPTLAPCLDQLRDEFDQAFPGRDKTSDGWIGDADHSNRDSDHNPDSRGVVHAIDTDEDLRDNRTTMRECVDEVVRRHRVGLDDRLTYVIYEGRIASPTSNPPWTWRTYGGSNPHDKHAHFSASYVRARETDRSPFGVLALARREDTPPVTSPTPQQTADAVWAKQTTIPGTSDARTVLDLLRYLHSASKIGEIVDALIGDEAIQGDVTALRADLTTALTKLDELLGKVETVSDRLNAIMSDPFDYPPNGNPEEHPFVMAFRYVNANPEPPAGA